MTFKFWRSFHITCHNIKKKNKKSKFTNENFFYYNKRSNYRSNLIIIIILFKILFEFLFRA